MTCPIRLQWEKQIENGISNLKIDQKNDYNRVGLVVKDTFWRCNKIFDYLVNMMTHTLLWIK